MLVRLDVFAPVASRFFFDHKSQGQWLHGWSSLILKKLLQQTFLKVTWVTEGLFEECPWHDFFLSPGWSPKCTSHCTRRYKVTKKWFPWCFHILSSENCNPCFWRMPGQPAFYWTTFSLKSAWPVALKKEHLAVRVLQVLPWLVFQWDELS